ncbi:MAG: glycosyltransferase family 39 protein [Acidobacteriota bacterium]|nr:glycosyltransferase family 39 protein [Acidobacteriota bacterium]MDH3523286.1 glycosyltransferase family 39 protein [Acidobacteriota bacterium]
MSGATARDLVVLVLVAGAFLGAGLGSRDLWNPNEPSYGRVVVEMVESGDWLVPRLNGEPFFEKPILYFWLAAVASKLMGGVSETSLRVPVLLLNTGSVLLLYLLVAAYDGRRRALVASALFATIYGVWFTARNAQMDSFVLFTTLAVVLALVRRLDHGAGGRSSWLLAGLAAGFGFAGKGPVTVIVPGLVLLVYLVVGRRPWRRLLPGLPLGVLGFLALALPWYAALYLGGRTDALHELLVRQNVERFVDAWDHQQAWYYYLKYFWLTFAPWSWLVPIVALSAWRGAAGGARDGRRLAWAWLAAPLVFFSLSESKREPYMLPVAPAVAWLAAWLLDESVAGRLRRWQAVAGTAVCGLLGAILLLAGAGALWPGTIEAPGLETALLLTGSLLAVAGAAVLVTIALRRTRRWAPAAAWAAYSLFLLFVGVYLHRVANPLKSHRPLAAELERAQPADSVLFSYFGRYRTVRGGYPYYLGRSIPDLADEERLRAAWAATARPCVLYEEDKYRDLVEGLPAAELVYESGVGSKAVHLVCRAAPAARPAAGG